MKQFFYKLIYASLILFIFMGCSDEVSSEKNINIIFRFDDPSALSSTETELKVISTFRENNASLTFGVIPFKCAGSTRDTSPQEVVPLGTKKGLLLKEAVEEGIVDIALHGYSHQIRDLDNWTEFSGMDYESQIEKLSKGKDYLEELIGTEVTAFIPPYNTYDSNTLNALEALQFSTISAGIRGVSDNTKLNYMPMTVKLHQLKDAVKNARASSDTQPLIVVMFHEYDFLDVHIDGITNRTISFEDLNEQLIWLKKQEDIDIISMHNGIETIQDLSAERLKLVKFYSYIKTILPKSFRDSISTYPEVSSLISVLMKIAFMYLFLLVVSLILSYYVLCSIFQHYVKLITMGITILTISFVIYAAKDFSIHFRGMTIIIILVGSSIGSWLCFKKNRKFK